MTHSLAIKIDIMDSVLESELLTSQSDSAYEKKKKKKADLYGPRVVLNKLRSDNRDWAKTGGSG